MENDAFYEQHCSMKGLTLNTLVLEIEYKPGCLILWKSKELLEKNNWTNKAIRSLQLKSIYLIFTTVCHARTYMASTVAGNI